MSHYFNKSFQKNALKHLPLFYYYMEEYSNNSSSHHEFIPVRIKHEWYNGFYSTNLPFYKPIAIPQFLIDSK